jgi:hypothetical protein
MSRIERRSSFMGDSFKRRFEADGAVRGVDVDDRPPMESRTRPRAATVRAGSRITSRGAR